jgi:hypothetical protein
MIRKVADAGKRAGRPGGTAGGPAIPGGVLARRRRFG